MRVSGTVISLEPETRSSSNREARRADCPRGIYKFHGYITYVRAFHISTLCLTLVVSNVEMNPSNVSYEFLHALTRFRIKKQVSNEKLVWSVSIAIVTVQIAINARVDKFHSNKRAAIVLVFSRARFGSSYEYSYTELVIRRLKRCDSLIISTFTQREV